MSFTELIP